MAVNERNPTTGGTALRDKQTIGEGIAGSAGVMQANRTNVCDIVAGYSFLDEGGEVWLTDPNGRKIGALPDKAGVFHFFRGLGSSGVSGGSNAAVGSTTPNTT